MKDSAVNSVRRHIAKNEAAEIIETAIRLILNHSIQRPNPDGSYLQWAHAKEINWTKYKDKLRNDFQTLFKLGNPDLIDVYGIINQALYRLDDGGHSRIDYRGYFRPFGDMQKYNAMMEGSWNEQRKYIEDNHNKPRQNNQASCEPPMPKAHKEKGFLYIWMPSFDGTADLKDLSLSEDIAENRAKTSAAKWRIKYEDCILEQLKSCADDKTRCIILDLRDNRGGFLSPMLYSLLPLFTSDPLNYKEKENAYNKHLFNIRYREAIEPITLNQLIEIAKQFTSGHSERVTKYFDPRLINMPVAVWCGESTCSAGEYILLSLSGRGASASFGQHTGGRSTWTFNDMLPYGARIDITKGYMCDLSLKCDGGKIAPDRLVENAGLFRKTEEWLLTQPSVDTLYSNNRPRERGVARKLNPSKNVLG